MKTSIKFFAALTIMMGFMMMANAQNAVTYPVTANATVQTKLVVSQLQALNFGTVDNVSGVSKTVSVLGVASTSGTASPAQTGVQEGIGEIVRTGGVVTYKLVSPPANLVGPTPSLLPIGTYTTAYSVATSGGAQTAGNSTVTNPTSVAAGTDDIYVHIGATVTPSAATTLPGSHTADITLSAEYN